MQQRLKYNKLINLGGQRYTAKFSLKIVHTASKYVQVNFQGIFLKFTLQKFVVKILPI
jgi:hypothetical protein